MWRHVVFWICWWIYFALTHAANPFNKPEISYFSRPAYTVTESVFLMLAQLPLAYTMMYVILPKLILKKKYVWAAIASFILFAIGGIYHNYLIADLLPDFMLKILPPHVMENTRRQESVSFFMAILANYKGAFTITAIALVIKFAKHWYLKEQRNLQLQKENSEAQLQLLTAQVHPHFLFNTLNNIYSKTQLESPEGARMILELSHIMRYVLDEGANATVPLENELQMLSDYINLEKLRYDNRLDMHVSLPSNTEGVAIAPLLLLPFVENCFKHGSSKMLANPWINLKIELQDHRLAMKLMNGKLANSKASGRQGTGIANVSKRLELLYPGRHTLEIQEHEEVFIVNLTLDLHPAREGVAAQAQPSTTTALQYA